MMPLDKRNSIIAKATGFLAVGHCFHTTASFYHTAGAQCMHYEHTFCVPFLCDGSARYQFVEIHSWFYVWSIA